jgi:hypothetical protein
MTAIPAPARRLTPLGGLRNTFTLTWRSVIKLRTNAEDLLGLSLQPIMYLVLFTYVFGGAIADGTHKYLQFSLPGILVLSMVFATLGFGLILGFRITTVPLAAAAGCLLLLLFALSMCWFSALIGLLAKTAQGVQWWDSWPCSPCFRQQPARAGQHHARLAAGVRQGEPGHLPHRGRARPADRRRRRHPGGQVTAVGARDLRGLRAARRPGVPAPDLSA